MKRLSVLLVACLLAAPGIADEVPAVVGWAQRVELGPLVSGVVNRVAVRPGQEVAAGDALLSLDDRGFRSEVARRLAAHRHAVAALEEARREDERAAELYDRTILSDFERNQATIALRAAEAAAEAARAALVQARLDLERSVLRAPFAGVVLAVDAAPGESVVSTLESRPLVTLADHRRLLARAEIDAARAAGLSAGRPLRAVLRDVAYDAVVSHVGLEPVAPGVDGPRYALVVEIAADPGAPLRVGETVTLQLD